MVDAVDHLEREDPDVTDASDSRTSSPPAEVGAGRDAYIQALRGVAIAVVVLIHCLPDGVVSVVLRPLLNWAVAMFVFLSGMLATEEAVARGGMVRRRLVKVAAPYLIWSLVYLVALRPRGACEAVVALATGGATAHLYFLLVYAQLAVLTPPLFKLLSSHRVALYLVTPLWLVCWEALAIMGVDVPSVAVLFPSWPVYYLVGLEWERWRERLRGRKAALVVAMVVAMAAQMGDGLLWYAHGDPGMATTQLRVTNAASSLAVIALFALAQGSGGERLSGCRALVGLGDLSFGIYLCHLAFLVAVRKALELAGIGEGPLGTVVAWVLALGLSAAAVAACRRVLPRRMRAALGL